MLPDRKPKGAISWLFFENVFLKYFYFLNKYWRGLNPPIKETMIFSSRTSTISPTSHASFTFPELKNSGTASIFCPLHNASRHS